jgi:hypothetical protein
MHIREYRKSLMVVKDIDSDFISEAYFVLKSGAEEREYGKISSEAERIIRECSSARKSKRRFALPSAAVTVAISAVAAAVAILVFILAYPW